jgi:release factor glutamine methyltransferase
VTPALFNPSVYTAALLLQLRRRADRIQGRTVLEIGTGSGVVIASLLDLGAAQALGVDVEPEAVDCTRRLLDGLGLRGRARVVQGDMWAPCAGQRFDLIAANLPQFPVLHPLDDGRLPTWSSGGTDGRALIDRFLQGLPRHLAPGGLVVMTHNVFVDLDRTCRALQALGLVATVAGTMSVPLAQHKLSGLPPQVLETFLERGLHRVGDFGFADFHVLEISHPDGRAELR